MFDFLTSHPYLTIWFSLAAMFWRAVFCGYVVDDDMHWKHMQEMKAKRKEIGWEHFLHDALYGAGFFRNAKIEHLATLTLHGINCSLIYHMTGSLLGAVLYLINPINNQTALWLNGRRYAVSLFFVLVAWNFWPLAPVMAVLAAWMHVSGLLMPLLFLCTPWWWMAALGSGMGAVMFRKQFKDVFITRRADYKDGNENQKIKWQKIILYVKSIGYYFSNCVWPKSPAMYHNFLFYFSSTEEGTAEGYKLNWDFWKGVAVISFLAWDHSFWAFWFVLFISQWCNLYQVTMNASDRYCTIANVGVMMLVVKYLAMIPAPYGFAAIAALAMFYIVKYDPLFMAYRNVENFHIYHLAQHPDLTNPRFFLSKIYLSRKDPWQAFGVIRQGLRYRPHDFKLLLGFIECLFALGKPKAALQAMDLAEKHIPFGEHEDTKNLFAGIRKEHQKEYDELHDLINGNKRYHNNGKPWVNPEKLKNRVAQA